MVVGVREVEGKVEGQVEVEVVAVVVRPRRGLGQTYDLELAVMPSCMRFLPSFMLSPLNYEHANTCAHLIIAFVMQLEHSHLMFPVV